MHHKSMHSQLHENSTSYLNHYIILSSYRVTWSYYFIIFLSHIITPQLVLDQRRYYKVVKSFQEECIKNEALSEALCDLQATWFTFHLVILRTKNFNTVRGNSWKCSSNKHLLKVPCIFRLFFEILDFYTLHKSNSWLTVFYVHGAMGWSSTHNSN